MNARRFVGIAIIAVMVLLLAQRSDVSERIVLAIAPSAERAYTYGLRHINVPDREHYDLESAEYFFSKAEMLDPKYPLVHHQLARIHFLEARYEEALATINREISNMEGERYASPFYLRGLIEGYLGDYDAAIRDYRTYVRLHPDGWEGRTDFAWVLIKAKRFDEALSIIEDGLRVAPDNPWLLSVKATTLFEKGRAIDAYPIALRAASHFDAMSESEWHAAYPGNDPEAAAQGIVTLRSAAHNNVEQIKAAAMADTR